MNTRFLLVIGTLTAIPLLGVPITYIFDGFAAGRLGPSFFPDTRFEITVQSDTETIINPFGSPFIFATGPAPTSIEVEGIGSASFLSGLSVYVHQIIREVGLTEPGSNDLFAVRDSLFMMYDLKSPIGPFTEPAPEDFVTFVRLPTTAGPATLRDIHDVTFTAEFTPQAVPEPRTITLSLLSGTALLVAHWRRKGEWKIRKDLSCV